MCGIGDEGCVISDILRWLGILGGRLAWEEGVVEIVVERGTIYSTRHLTRPGGRGMRGFLSSVHVPLQDGERKAR